MVTAPAGSICARRAAGCWRVTIRPARCWNFAGAPIGGFSTCENYRIPHRQKRRFLRKAAHYQLAASLRSPVVLMFRIDAANSV